MLRGLDLSIWQNVGTGDGDYDFIIAKATEGVGYTDPNCDGHYQRAKSQGKLLGVYHFARPGYNDAISEADWFLHEIQGYIGEAILILDWEVEAVWNVGWAKQWLDRVYEKTGVKPMIYMSGSVATAYDWSSVVNADYGLWIAYWPNKYQYSWDWPTSPDEMTFGTGAWPFWAIWQFSSRDGQLDCDVANMTKEGWMKYAAKNGQPEPAPTPTPTPTPEPTPTPTPAKFKVGDKVVPTRLVDYNGNPLTQWDDYYTISELNGDRAVLTADRNGKPTVWAAMNTNDLALYGGQAGLQVGDKVTLKDWVDIYGTPLIKTRAFYYIGQIINNYAVLRADNATNGTIYAAVYLSNLSRV